MGTAGVSQLFHAAETRRGRPGVELELTIGPSHRGRSDGFPFHRPFRGAGPRSPIEKSLFMAPSRQGWEESSARSDLGIAVSGGAGTGCQGPQRLWPVVLGRGGGGQTCGKAEIPRNPAAPPLCGRGTGPRAQRTGRTERRVKVEIAPGRPLLTRVLAHMC